MAFRKARAPNAGWTHARERGSRPSVVQNPAVCRGDARTQGYAHKDFRTICCSCRMRASAASWEVALIAPPGAVKIGAVRRKIAPCQWLGDGSATRSRVKAVELRISRLRTAMGMSGLSKAVSRR